MENGTTPNVQTAPEDKELNEMYQTYMQKCCEVGQIEYNLRQLDGQRRDLEKQLEVTQKAVDSASAKHRELQKQKYAKMQPTKVVEPKLEMNEAH